MKRIHTKGVCQLCQGVFGKVAMTRHLAKCLDAHPGAGNAPDTSEAVKGKLFHLVVQQKYATPYWLHIEIPASATLYDLDRFLRHIWLECCGHLSAFTIKGVQFSSNGGDGPFGSGWNERDMSVRVGKVFARDLKFIHEYDFGSTTQLELKVVGERLGAIADEHKVTLLARNEPPEIKCSKCGQPAAWIWACGWGEEGALCEKCRGKLDEGLLPVVNSPRMGVCGYSG